MGKKERTKGAQFEREVAAVLGAERVGARGRPDAEHADIVHPDCLIECKRRKDIAIYQWWRDLRGKAQLSGKTPVLVIREDREEALMVVSLEEAKRRGWI